MKINEIMCAFGLKSIQFCQRNFEVMLIESFSNIQGQIEYVNNSKIPRNGNVGFTLQQVFQSINFPIYN